MVGPTEPERLLAQFDAIAGRLDRLERSHDAALADLRRARRWGAAGWALLVVAAAGLVMPRGYAGGLDVGQAAKAKEAEPQEAVEVVARRLVVRDELGRDRIVLGVDITPIVGVHGARVDGQRS